MCWVLQLCHYVSCLFSSVIQVAEVVQHAGWKPTHFNHDYAILTLADPLDFSSDSVNAVCMERFVLKRVNG